MDFYFILKNISVSLVKKILFEMAYKFLSFSFLRISMAILSTFFICCLMRDFFSKNIFILLASCLLIVAADILHFSIKERSILNSKRLVYFKLFLIKIFFSNF